jgi:hypothetical protein
MRGHSQWRGLLLLLLLLLKPCHRALRLDQSVEVLLLLES